MKKLLLSLLLAFLCAAAPWAAESFAAAKTSEVPAELEGTWVWKSAEGDGHFETWTYTFGRDGGFKLEERLPGRGVHKAAGVYESDGRRLRVKLSSGAFSFGGAELEVPYAREGGILAVCILDGVYIFKAKK